MKTPCNELREFIYTKLYGSIIYNSELVIVASIPPKEVEKPYVRIGKMTMTEEGAKDSYMSKVNAQIEVVTNFQEKLANFEAVENISNSVTSLLVDQIGNTSNFHIIWCHLMPSNEDEQLKEDGIDLSNLITFEYYVEQK